MDIDEPLAALARSQHGLVTFDQLRAHRWAPTTISEWRERGWLQTVRRGVHAFTGSRPTWERSVLAACLAAGTGTLASGDTAARLWGLEAEPSPIEIAGPPGRRIRLVGVIAHRYAELGTPHQAVRNQIPVLSAARMLIECSGRWGLTRSGRALDQLIRDRSVRLSQVRTCLAELGGPGRRRLEVIRTLVEERVSGDDQVESRLEQRVLRVLVSGGLPPPTPQHWVRVGGRRYRLDLAYPQRQVAIEVDGWAVHGARSAFTADRARANDLVVAGWQVLRVTADMSDATILRTVRAALAS